MKRIAVLTGLLVVLVTAYLIVDQMNLRNVSAQPRDLTVEVMFRPLNSLGTEVDREDRPAGELCSYMYIQMEIWPHSKQVVITDAAGIIVGTVDLLDVFNPVVSPAPDEAQSGVINEDGLCVVTKTLEVEESAFYTFTIPDTYRWTVSRAELDARGWSILVDFYE